MEQFTREAAKRWIGHTIIAKSEVDIEHTQIGAEEQGTVIGVDGSGTVQGNPSMRLAVQFWLEKKDTLPETQP